MNNRLSLAWLTLLSACGGASGAADQARLGAELYGARCAVCHEQDATIGTRLDAVTLRSYRTAKALYDYTSFAMPYDAPRSLGADQYWAVTAHMLRSRGLIEADLLLGPENASALDWADTEP